MTGHHISEHARLKILRPVLKRMYNHAVSVVFGDWFVTNLPFRPYFLLIMSTGEQIHLLSR